MVKRLPWYERYPERFEEELRQMQARGYVLNEEALAARKTVEFSGQSIADPERPLVVRYPDAFPSFPPRVFSEMPSRILVRAHQPESKEICLFGPGQPRWSAKGRGTDAIDEAEAIIRQFGNEADSEVFRDDVPEPSTAVYRYDRMAAIIVPATIAARVTLSSQGIAGEFNLRLDREAGLERGVMVNLKLSGQTIKAGALYNSWFPRGRPVRGNLVVLSTPPPYMTTLEEFETWLASIGVHRDKWMAFVFPEESGSASSTRTAWLLINSSANGTLRLVKTFPLVPSERLARVPRTSGLANKKVAFVGCGSLGSKIAVPLAATGISRFSLIDSESYEPNNSVRHEVTIDHFGVPKVWAVYQRLLGFNPEIAGQVDIIFTRIGAPNPIEDEERLVNTLASADMIIDATGSHPVSRFINELAYDLGIPSLYASVTNGAWGGEIVRVIPRETACWMCWLNQYELSRPPSEPEPEYGVFAPGCNQPTFTGTSYETGIVANMAAWMAAESLLRREAGHRDFSGDYLRWEARDQDGAPLPNVKVLAVERRPDCPVCGRK